MDLYHGSIKIRTLMKNPGAREILQREFPGVINSPLFRMAQNMTLNQVIRSVSGKVSKEKINSVLQQLKAL